MVDAALHLPSLSIQNFRGISDLTIERLGRVTLIAGRNGIGKTTLLDAVQVYAARGNYATLIDVLNGREEITPAVDPDGDEVYVPDFESLIYGRHPTEDSCISIGTNGTDSRLNIKFGSGLLLQEAPLGSDILIDDEPLLRTEFQGIKNELYLSHLMPMYRAGRRRPLRPPESRIPTVIPCETSGPGLMDNNTIARFWDAVALTSYEDKAVQALQLIYGDAVERVAMVGDERRIPQRYGRRAIAKMTEQERPVPLRSLGDGAARLFGIALALANSKDGILVIDEAENGIHHSVQTDFWKMVIQTAQENNVQVMATTHGWDCVVGFAQALEELNELESLEGGLVRLDQIDERLQPVEYTAEDLQIVARQGIEVR